jgi:hypothetical protein
MSVWDGGGAVFFRGCAVHDRKKSRSLRRVSVAFALGVASLSLLLSLFTLTGCFGVESLLLLLVVPVVSHGSVRGMLSYSQFH